MNTIDPAALPADIRRRANSIARGAGYGRATAVVFTDGVEKVVSGIRSGYRKKKTGEYVSIAYARKGFSSVYYQVAECVVALRDDKE